MKKLIVILFLLSLLSCEKNLEIEPDPLVGTWELNKIWFNENGVFENKGTIQCLGKTLEGIQCRNMTTEIYGYCYLHKDQIHSQKELTFSTREKSIEYIKSVNADLPDYKIYSKNGKHFICTKSVVNSNSQWVDNHIEFDYGEDYIWIGKDYYYNNSLTYINQGRLWIQPAKSGYLYMYLKIN